MPTPSDPVLQIASNCSLEEQRHVANGLLTLVPDPEVEFEFSAIAASINYHYQSIKKLASKAIPNLILNKGLLEKSNKTALAAMLIQVSVSKLNRGIAGEKARRYLALLAVEIVTRNPSLLTDESIAVLGRLVRHEISSGTKHSAIPDPRSLIGLIGWLNNLPQNTTKFTAEFWRYWRRKNEVEAWKIVNGKSYAFQDSESENDSAHDPIYFTVPESGISEFTPTIIEIPEPEVEVEKNRTRGIQKVVIEALQSTYTPIHALTESSTTNLTDEEVQDYVGSTLIEIEEIWKKNDHLSFQSLLGRLVILVTGSSADKVLSLQWIDLNKERPKLAEGISLDCEWFIRREYVPDNAFRFEQNQHNRTVWIPIPQLLQKWLKALKSNPKHLQTVFDYLRDSLPAVGQTTVTITTLRRTFFSRIARLEPLGITGAQWACGDSFGLDISPIYYDRYPADALAKAIEKVTFAWFREKPKKSRKTIPRHDLGSKVPNDKSEYSLLLRQVSRSECGKKEIDEKISFINRMTYNLVHGIVLATGHRPNNNFSKLTLKNFDLVEGIGIIADKAVDPSWLNRPVSIPAQLCSEINLLVSELRNIAELTVGTKLSQWATEAIWGTGPLFIKIHSEDEVEVFSKNDYLENLPTELLECDNFARHWLNQYLIGNVSEMLRVGQLGWHGTRAGAWSDLSPMSVREGCRKLRPIINQYLKRIGWRSVNANSKEEMDYPINIDWIESELIHEREYRTTLNQLYRSYAHKNSLLAKAILPELELLIEQKWPGKFSIDDNYKLQWANASNNKQEIIKITEDDIKHMAFAVSRGNKRSQEYAIAFNLVSLVFRIAKNRSIVDGKIPYRKVFKFGSGPGPFKACAPMALVASRKLEDWLMHKDCQLSLQSRTLIALIHFGGYTDIQKIITVMNNAKLVRSKQYPDVILAEPNDARQTIAFSGMAALHLAHWTRDRKELIVNRNQINDEIYNHLPDALKPKSVDETLDQLASLIKIRNSLAMGGIARLVGTEKVNFTSISASKMVALQDNLPVVKTEKHTDCSESMLRFALGNTNNSNDKLSIRKLTAEISKCQKHRSHYTGLSEVETRKQLRMWLVNHCNPNKSNQQVEHLLVRFAVALLDKNSESSRLQYITILGYIGVIAHSLKKYLGSDPLAKTQEEWQEAYLQIIASSTPDMRVRKRDALYRFHNLAGEQLKLPNIDFAILSDIAGDRKLFVNPGYLTKDMKNQVVKALERDIIDLDRQNASADELHEAKARYLYFHLISTSTLRPRECWALSINDIIFNANSTFIRIRSRGFQNLKTVRARRRILLKGDVVADCRIQLERWIANLESIHGNNYNINLPLFSRSKDPTALIDRAHISSRVNELLRWITDDPEAVAYWARKSDIYDSMSALQSGTHESLWPARDLLGRAGQAGIKTTCISYTHDVHLLYMRWFKDQYNTFKSKDIGIAIGRSVSRYRRKFNSESISGGRSDDIRQRVSALIKNVPIFNSIGSEYCLPAAIKSSGTFQPTLSAIDQLMRSISSGTDVKTAAMQRSWPSQSILRLEQVLHDLSQNGIAFQQSDNQNVLIKPPRNITALNRAPKSGYVYQIGNICFDHQSFLEMADSWVKFASFIGADKGIPGTTSEWSTWETVAGSVPMGAWSSETVQYLDCRLPAHYPGVSTSPWPMLRWNLILYWLKNKI